MRFFARLCVLLVLFCLPFLVLMLASRRNQMAGMVLVVPVFFLAPMALSALVVRASNARTLLDKLPGLTQLGAVLGAVGGILWRVSDWAVGMLGLRAVS
jgi:hypothetical protein